MGDPIETALLKLEELIEFGKIRKEVKNELIEIRDLIEGER